MMLQNDARVTVVRTRGRLLATVQSDLSGAVLTELKRQLLGSLAEGDCAGIVVDVSALDLIDGHEFKGLRSVLSIAGVMGCPAAICGLSPGVVSSLIDLDVDIRRLVATLSVDDAMASLDHLSAAAS